MTDPALVAYRRWRIFVFAVVIIVASLTIGILVAVVATSSSVRTVAAPVVQT